LISPNAHEIYYSELKIYKDKDFPHEINPDNKTQVDSDLKGRVICLPYKFENVLSQLYHTYLKSLEEAQRREELKSLEERSNREIGKLTRWDDCLTHYLECEHIEKLKQIIDQKICWDTLMKINYELGGKIIVKSFMSFLCHVKERQEWFHKYIEHLPVSPQKIEVDINESEGLFLKFRQPSELPLRSYNLYTFYKSLLEIYDKHLVFSNGDVSKTENNRGLSLNQIVEYLGLWKENIPLINYPERRKGKYGEEIKLQQKIDEYYENSSWDLKKDIIRSVTDIEVQELGKLFVRSSTDLH
jgi:hypothetical protein